MQPVRQALKNYANKLQTYINEPIAECAKHHGSLVTQQNFSTWRLKDNGNRFFYSRYLLNIPTEYLITYFTCLSRLVVQKYHKTFDSRPPS
jgi:hypothetical protein